MFALFFHSQKYTLSMNLPTTCLLSLLLILLVAGCSAPRITSDAEPPQHTQWDSLLRDYVDENGLVNYKGLQKDSARLQSYLQLLERQAPNPKKWSDAEQMAYWINAYNAYTLQLILRHYPLASIKDIKNGIPFVNTVWDIKFIEIAGEQLDLNNIEHGILRENFDDPRIHFALVCASMSCPKLVNRAFTADKLDAQLDRAAREFFSDPFRNQIDATPVKISKILDWYWTDFKDKYAGHYALVNAYTDEDLTKDTTVEFLDYDWSLNEQTPKKRAVFE
ncbi:MAG: DUF547 domain-containing protein [Bacteroidota bacterium]